MTVVNKDRPDQEAAPADNTDLAQYAGAPKKKAIFDFEQAVKIIDALCYSLGSSALNAGSTLGCALKALGATFRLFVAALFKGCRRGLRRYAVRSHLPLDELKDLKSRTASAYQKARQRGVWGLALFAVRTGLSVFAQFLRTLLSSPSYFAPVLAAVVFAVVVHAGTQLNFGLAVEYNGEFVGYITDESVFDRADKQMLGRIVYEEYVRPNDVIPKFSMAIVDKENLMSVNDLTNALIQASGNELQEAYGLYVADSFVGAAAQEVQITGLLNGILDSYRTEASGETVEFVKTVEIREGLYPLSSVVGIDAIAETLNREESQKQIYTAQKGDAPTLIAQKNNVPYSELKALNPGIETKLLVGQEVLVARSVPFLGVKVIREETYEQEVNFKIQQTQDTAKLQGYVNIKQVGQRGVNQILAKVTYIDGVESSREIVSTTVLKEPVNEIVVVGGMKPLEQLPASAMNTSTGFIWPVDGGGYVSCAFNGYPGHTGMDIAGLSAGTGVRAAASGTVVMVKNLSTGYGRHVMIDHGGNVQTLYAHNSQIYVKVGDWVEQGQLIAAMGRTGRATGVHLHFEIRINGRYMNPAKYIGYK